MVEFLLGVPGRLVALGATLTWGTTGGAAGNVTQAVYAYSANSGSTYDTVGTLSITYDTAGYVTGTTWS